MKMIVHLIIKNLKWLCKSRRIDQEKASESEKEDWTIFDSDSSQSFIGYSHLDAKF